MASTNRQLRNLSSSCSSLPTRSFMKPSPEINLPLHVSRIWDIRMARRLKHWACHSENPGSNSGHSGPTFRILSKLFTIIFAPIAPTSLRLSRTGKYSIWPWPFEQIDFGGTSQWGEQLDFLHSYILDCVLGECPLPFRSASLGHSVAINYGAQVRRYRAAKKHGDTCTTTIRSS